MLHRSMLGLCLLAAVGAATAGTVTRVSVMGVGRQARGASWAADISADGRYVAFCSNAANLVANDTNQAIDVFVHDRAAGSTSRVSVNSEEQEGEGASVGVGISADGRYVVFQSWARNLDGADTNSNWDVFVRDRVSGSTSRIPAPAVAGSGRYGATAPAISADGRWVAYLFGPPEGSANQVYLYDRVTQTNTLVSASASGEAGNGNCSGLSLSDDGRYVAFDSFADNIALPDTNEKADVFVYDRATGRATLASQSAEGQQGNGHSIQPALSATGRYLVYLSEAGNLVPGDTNQQTDVFLCDRATGAVSRESLSRQGTQLTGHSSAPGVSADGRYVAFLSSAAELVPGSYRQGNVFVRDRVSGQVTLASLTLSGAPSLSFCGGPCISADGRAVAFSSEAPNIVRDDTNQRSDVFVHDRDSTPAPAPPSPDDPPVPATDYTPGTLLRANLHSHTNASTNWNDHIGAPTVRALIQRACDLGLTVLGISDHAEAVSEAEWRALLNGTTPPTRVRAALRGCEWTQAESAVPGSGGNHINVFGAQGTAIANSDGEGAGFGDLRSDVPSFYNWLADAPGIYGTAPVGQFNHISMDGSHFGNWALPTNARVKKLVLSRMALAELAIGSHEGAGGVQPQEVIPDNPREGEVQWRAALLKGWRLAPSFGADNYAGLSDDARRFHTGVYLYSTDSPGQWSVMRALAGRRAFASQDTSAEAQLYVGGYFMGCQDVPTTSPVRIEVRYRPYKNPPQIDGPQATCELWWKSGHKVLTGTVGWDGKYFIWRAGLRATGRGNWLYARITQNDGDLIYTAPVWFDVTSAATATAPLVVSSAVALPTRQGGAQVGFTLSAAATVAVTVTNIAGRPIRCVGSGLATRAGANTVLWDGRSDRGLAVPAGRYLVKIAARTEDGQQASALAAVNLSR